jgi:hypothetical protein
MADHDTTDLALSVTTGVGLAACFICILYAAWRQPRWQRPAMNHSRSDPDLENLQDLVADAIPTNR